MLCVRAGEGDGNLEARKVDEARGSGQCAHRRGAVGLLSENLPERCAGIRQPERQPPVHGQRISAHRHRGASLEDLRLRQAS